jgi:EAL domain-containing protein (putative c-di-GMP-specific phosphodiesterase class I)
LGLKRRQGPAALPGNSLSRAAGCRPRPDRGLVPPAEFIPLAEETGLVVELDRFVPRQACLQMAG